jgi:hypothetical protein
MTYKTFTKVVVIIGNILLLPIILTLRLWSHRVYALRQYLETNELTGELKYAYIVRPFDLCGLFSDYVDRTKDYPENDEEGVISSFSPLVTIDIKSIKEGKIIVFDSFEKFDEYRENKYKLVLSEKKND